MICQWILKYDIKKEIYKLGFIKIKKKYLCFKEHQHTMKKLNRQTIEWEKIFTNFIKRLIARIYNEPLSLNNKNTNNSF